MAKNFIDIPSFALLECVSSSFRRVIERQTGWNKAR